MNFNNFDSSVLIEFDPKCRDSIKSWLDLKLKSSKENNGAELKTQFLANRVNKVKVLRFKKIKKHTIQIKIKNKSI